MSANLDLHHLAAAYALDALDADERIAFEAHYHDCHVCSHDVGDFRSTLAALGELSATAPSADLKARVLEQIATTRQLSPLVSTRALATPKRRMPLLAAAAALLLLVATTAFVVGRDSGSDDGFAAQLEEVLAAPDVQLVDLPATSPATDGSFRVAWSPALQRAAVLADGLSTPDDGLVYELWLIDETGALATGMLDAAENGEVRRIVPMAGVPVKWGITLEPAAGSQTPSDVLFLGNA